MVLIDVDGTLVDSVPDLAFCVDEMMLRLGLQPHGEEPVRNWVGNGVERLVRRALVGQLDGEPDEQLFEQAYPIFLELYADNSCKRTQLYPGVSEGMEYLQSQGYKLGCVTNKAEQFTLPILKQLSISVICSECLLILAHTTTCSMKVHFVWESHGSVKTYIGFLMDTMRASYDTIS